MAHERVHQNATAPGIALQHTLQGSPVQGVGGVSHAHGAVQPAGIHSTAPYKPPKRRGQDNLDKPLCAYEDCKAFPIKTTDYCVGHSRNLKIGPYAPTTDAKDSDDDTGSPEATGSTADGDDAG